MTGAAATDRSPLVERRAALVEVLDRTLQTGVALSADLTLSIAGVDLVSVDLRAVLRSAATSSGDSYDHGAPAESS